MSIKTVVDSKKNKHKIAFQEKTCSCAMACIQSILYLYKGNQAESEAEIRQKSQSFFGGYRPHPRDIHSPELPLSRTFISQLIQLENKDPKIDIGLPKDRRKVGTRDAIGDTLATYHIFSDKKVLNEIYYLKEHELARKLQGKILILGVKTIPNQTHHSIIIRDVRKDGTFVIYDPADGLIETKDISKHYDLFWDKNNNFGDICDFAIEQKKLCKTMSLKPKPANDEVIASDYQPNLITTLSSYLKCC